MDLKKFKTKSKTKNTSQQTILPRAIATAAVRQYWRECDRAQSFLYPTARRAMLHEVAPAVVRSLVLPVPSALLPGLLAARGWRSTWLWPGVRQAVRDEWRRSEEIKDEFQFLFRLFHVCRCVCVCFVFYLTKWICNVFHQCQNQFYFVFIQLKIK